jgi:hypothetical protein
LSGGAVGGTLPGLRTDHVVRIVAEDVPKDKESWRGAVTTLFKVNHPKPLVVYMNCRP